MILPGVLTATVSALRAEGTRVAAVADNVVNIRTPGYAPKTVRTTSVVDDAGSNAVRNPGGGIRATVIEEDGEVDLGGEFTRLIQARTAYGANVAFLRTADEIAGQTVDIKT